jgi:hypothetical protein
MERDNWQMTALRRRAVEMKGYDFTEGEGDTITCDYCSQVVSKWYSDLTHAICRACLINKVVIGEGERV